MTSFPKLSSVLSPHWVPEPSTVTSSQVFKGPGLVHVYSPATAFLVALARTTVFLCLIWYPSTKTCLSTLWSFTMASHTTTCPGSLVTTQSTFPHSHLPQNLSNCLICPPPHPKLRLFPITLYILSLVPPIPTNPSPVAAQSLLPAWFLCSRITPYPDSEAV